MRLYFCYAAVQQPNLSHPFHLHGYGMNVIGIGRSPDTNVKKINLKHALDLDRRGLLHRQYNLPPIKDTIAVPNNGYVVLRFRADNPGRPTWLVGLCNVTHYKLSSFTYRVSCHGFSEHQSLEMQCTYSKKNLLFYRFLAVPLSFPVPHCDRNESCPASGNARRPPASSSYVSYLWRSFARNSDKLTEFNFHSLPYPSLQILDCLDSPRSWYCSNFSSFVFSSILPLSFLSFPFVFVVYINAF